MRAGDRPERSRFQLSSCKPLPGPADPLSLRTVRGGLGAAGESPRSRTRSHRFPAEHAPAC